VARGAAASHHGVPHCDGSTGDVVTQPASFTSSFTPTGCMAMDPTPIAGMIFTLLLAMSIGGFILLFPLSRKLGQLLEQRLGAKPPLDDDIQQQLTDLRQMLEGMQADLLRIREHQEFVENLVVAPKHDVEKLKP